MIKNAHVLWKCVNCDSSSSLLSACFPPLLGSLSARWEKAQIGWLLSSMSGKLTGSCDDWSPKSSSQDPGTKILFDLSFLGLLGEPRLWLREFLLCYPTPLCVHFKKLFIFLVLDPRKGHVPTDSCVVWRPCMSQETLTEAVLTKLAVVSLKC